MKKLLTLLLLASLFHSAIAQTLPPLFNLSSGNYTFSSWPANAGAGTFPANMRLHYTTDPTVSAFDSTAEAAGDYDCAYNLAARSRFNARGDDGIGFISTGNGQFSDCIGATTLTENRFSGAAVVGLNATGLTNVYVRWVGRLVSQGNGTVPRPFSLRLQYRLTASGNYQDVTSSGNPVEFLTKGRSTGDVATIAATLPPACDNQPVLYLRWIYFQMPETGESGTRPEIALDNINIGSELLPLLLKGFSATLNQGKTTVSWKTEKELSLSYFEVERSVNDGPFATIQKLAPGANANGSYTIIDNSVYAKALYRLRICDLDGSCRYSQTVLVKNIGSDNISVWPNPARASIEVAHPMAGAAASIKIVSADGRTLQRAVVNQSAFQTHLDISKLTSGLYTIIFEDRAIRRVSLFTKQ